jgi:hypothetical protein
MPAERSDARDRAPSPLREEHARGAVTAAPRAPLAARHDRAPLAGPRVYLALVVLLLFAAALATVAQPGWFVASTGRVAVFGGPLSALALAAGLWWRSALAYLLTLLGATLWIGVAVGRYRGGDVGEPAAQLGLAIAMAAVVALLVLPPSVRRYFFARAD